MDVQVRLFAVFRERAGRETLSLQLDDGATVADALAAAAREPGLGEILAAMPVRAALNRSYVDDDAVLSAGDEIALVPPVSGGSATAIHSRVTGEPLSVERVSAAVGRPGAGAIVVFCGVTRAVERLEYEAYEEMASERITEILEGCLVRHRLEAAAAEHRTGEVPLGEPSVIVAVSAAHRGEAFAGAREAIDRIKAEAPIWKREVDGDAATWVPGTIPPSDGAPNETTSLTHLDESGSARMVDVGAKPVTERRALARARVRMAPQTAAAVERGDAPKGDVLGVARIAGIGAAKRTWELIPLCHPLALDFVDVEAEVDTATGLVEISAEAGTTARTGVEMEAMTACSVAALTVYDMVKGLERGVAIEEIALLRKSGGRSGDWERS
jgi:molybdenum cofactor biosynthesis protein MoaC/molybdopterin converting factor subunit 1